MPKKDLDLSFLKQSSEELELPSKGLIYNKSNPLSSGKIHIRPWLTSEEKLIDKFDKGNFYNIVKRLVECVVEENISVEDMSDADLFFTLYWIRILTYGPSYTVETTCPECDERVKIKINIQDYPIKYLEEFKEPLNIDLPSGIKLRMRYPRFGDLIESTESKHSDIYKMGIKVSPDIYRFALCTEEMELPNAEHDILSDENTNGNFLKLTLDKIWCRLPAKDILTIRQYLTKFDHGYTENIEVKCPECEKYFNQAPVLAYDFFRPSNRESANNS